MSKINTKPNHIRKPYKLTKYGSESLELRMKTHFPAWFMSNERKVNDQC